jgi:hypothetical protein
MAHRQFNNPLAIAARAHARGRLLDVGCGEKPYAPLFATWSTSTSASYRVGPLRIPIGGGSCPVHD